MSFRTRLTSFFVVIVVLPMIAVGILVFRLIGDSAHGKADARANGLATATATLYQRERALARRDAQTIARNLSGGAPARDTVAALAAKSGVARVVVTSGRGTIADIGDKTAIAPGTATIAGSAPITVTVSELTASDFIHDMTAPGVGAVIRQGHRVLAATPALANRDAIPPHGSLTLNGTDYRTVTQSFKGFGRLPVAVTVLSDVSATSTSVDASRAVAAAFIVGFLLLALAFSILASRALQGQLSRFLDAARRIGAGDFSATVPTDGRDEFAALGHEFNSMSSQLSRRLEELSEERARLRESIRRIGQTFAANLDRPVLLELALKTAVDAVQADCGRLSVRATHDEPLVENGRVGSLQGHEDAIISTERAALKAGEVGESSAGDTHVASVPLGPLDQGGRAHGIISVARRGRPFNDDDHELLRSLGSQATLALENVELHFQVQRQAVTDELTGLANHGRFQELLGAEIEQVRRYRHHVGLIMLDLDDFKSINDTYGHQQGDVVLRHVARVLRENSRETDAPARYGGEEMALILPHTELEGTFAIAERVRSAVEGLRIPRIDGQGMLRITTSVGVTASNDGDKDGLIADADSALYEAKRQGKNGTVHAAAPTANVSGAG